MGAAIGPAREGWLILFAQLFMDAPTKGMPDYEEAFKRNLRFRLHHFTTNDGRHVCLVEIAAWNAWAEQAKIISAIGGLDPEQARGLFESAQVDIRSYNWITGEIVMENK